ncbi:diguanylate cyclase [Krasilnikovia sp. MM14-A1004]|uniref:tetratricopeptide repeat-containing diguanylate cyclase n=1 Tax=Krasilnikovia sp. MM14-A1004 TaxID=3373541 RepID=UPI00399C56AA
MADLRGVDAVDGVARSAEELSAALLAIEDRMIVDVEAAFTTAVELERQAAVVGDEPLHMRARLCRAGLLRRMGAVADAAKEFTAVHQWAVEQIDRRLQARVHVSWANLERMAGDAAKSLEHALSAVEVLDETATAYMQIMYPSNLADALVFNGQVEAARPRYREAERLARKLGRSDLLPTVLNDWAYAEYSSGDFLRAREVAQRLQEYAAEHDLDLLPSWLDTIGAIQIENGEYAEAEQTMQRCIARHEAGDAGDDDYLAEYLLTLARAQRGVGAIGRAQVSLDASRALCTERELQEVLLRVHQEQAELHAARGEHAEAFDAMKVFFAAREHLLARQEQDSALARHAEFETAEARDDANRFREQARRDPLTGLHNRRYVDEELPALVAADPDLTVAIADIDHFKRINDELTHDTGDQVLVKVAKLLDTELAAVIPEGFVARLGGEEFLLVLPATPVTLAVRQLDGIRRAIGEHDWRDTTGGLPVTVSIGVAGVNEASPRSQSAALSTADRNLYAAKHAGRNRVVAGTEPEPRQRAYRDRTAP